MPPKNFRRALLLGAVIGIGVAALGAWLAYLQPGATAERIARFDRWMTAVATAGALVAVGMLLYGVFIWRKYLRATANEDPAFLRRIADRRGAALRKHGGLFALQADLFEVGALMAEERFAEAVRVIDRLDVSVVPQQRRALVQAGLNNNLAWCLVQLDAELDRAAELARGVVEVARTAKVARSLLPAAVGTYGAALARLGRPAEARPLLEEALRAARGAVPKAASLVYLGDVHLALGENDGARAAFEEAQSLAPESRWGARARQKLRSS